MKFDNENNTLTVYLSGRIDANNAPDIESEIAEVLAKNPGIVPTFDASELEYISSAGLRVLLKFRKQFGKSIDVLNVSSDVYDIFEVTGFTELLNVKKRLREISLEGLEVIGGGNFSTVYRIDPETIVKVFTHFTATLSGAESDQKTSREVFLHDIPTAISYDVVKAGEHYGLVYEMINAETVSRTLRKQPERLEELSIKMARLMKKLHTTEFKTGTFPDARDIMHNMMNTAVSKGTITADDKALIDELIDRIPYRNTLVHFDYHPNNVLVSNNELVLIDVGGAGQGSPIADLMTSYAQFVSMARRAAEHGVKNHEKSIGLNPETLSAMWDIIMSEYFGTTDRETLKRYEEVISNYTPIFELFALSVGHIPDDKRAFVARPIMEHFRKVIPELKPIENI